MARLFLPCLRHLPGAVAFVCHARFIIRYLSRFLVVVHLILFHLFYHARPPDAAYPLLSGFHFVFAR